MSTFRKFTNVGKSIFLNMKTHITAIYLLIQHVWLQGTFLKVKRSERLSENYRNWNSHSCTCQKMVSFRYLGEFLRKQKFGHQFQYKQPFSRLKQQRSQDSTSLWGPGCVNLMLQHCAIYMHSYKYLAFSEKNLQL